MVHLLGASLGLALTRGKKKSSGHAHSCMARRACLSYSVRPLLITWRERLNKNHLPGFPIPGTAILNAWLTVQATA